MEELSREIEKKKQEYQSKHQIKLSYENEKEKLKFIMSQSNN